MHQPIAGPVTIIANSGYAAEVASIVESLGAHVHAIYGTTGAVASARHLGVEFIESQPDLASLPNASLIVLSIGHVNEREALHRRLIELGCPPITLVHPDATVGLAVHIGEGSIVSPGARLTASAVVTTDVEPGTTVVGVPARPLR